MLKKINILLLTNRDSDNTGDQVIEACDIGLISTVMQNLGFKEDEYAISSRAAAIVTKNTWPPGMIVCWITRDARSQKRIS